MVFDEETAPIVQKIFQWKIEGLSLPAIADRLDAMNAPNPVSYTHLDVYKRQAG